MKVPDFFIVGAAKAGTTSLFNYLIQHPQIFVPSIKEPHFFSDYVHAGAPKLEGIADYLNLFRQCQAHQHAGDVSTSYLYSRNAAERIRDLQPNAKIVIVLRNPIDRAYSFYWYNRNRFVEPLSFEEALRQEPQRIADGWHFRFHYVESGKYHGQVKRYLDTFGADAVKVYLFEDLVRDADILCRDIFSFLGVSGGHQIRTDQVFNRSGVPRSGIIGRALLVQFPGRKLIRRLLPMPARALKNRVVAFNTRPPPKIAASTRAELTESFRQDIDQLATLLDRELSHWLSDGASAAQTPSGPT